jgi:hypothetical protein
MKKKLAIIDLKGDFLDFFIFMYDIQHCFICRLSAVSEEAEIEHRTVATLTLTNKINKQIWYLQK